MALVATKVFRSEIEDQSVLFVTLAFDNSYPTGGESITANAIGLTRINGAIIPGNVGYTFTWDGTNSKVLVYYGDNNNASDGPGIELPDTTDASAITAAPALFFGI